MSTEKEPVDRLVKVYIKMRDKRTELKRAYEEQDNEIVEQMEVITKKLLDTCVEIGASSFKTPFGTVTRTVKTRYWPSDWEAMHAFIKEHDALSLLEQRVHQTNMKQFLTDNPNLLPPGLNADHTYDVSVRRS
jgi:hypothetical protein